MIKRIIGLIAAWFMLFFGYRSTPNPYGKDMIIWKDYLADGGYPSEELRITVEEFPDTEFIWDCCEITAVCGDEKKVIISGMPIWNTFFDDLNYDGYPEICSTVTFGSGIVDEHIVVYDYHNGKEYYLWERMDFDFRLFSDYGELFAERVPYSTRNDEDCRKETGRLRFKDGILVM